MKSRSSIGTLKGIGEKTENLFHRMGIYRIEDLIRYYPRGFEIYDDPVPISEVEEGKINTIAGSVFGRIAVSGNRSMQITTLNLKDLTGTIKVLWFRMPFLRNTLGKGGTLILRGRVVRRRDALVMEHPEIFYPASRYEEKRYSMQPVYPLTAGLTNNAVIKARTAAIVVDAIARARVTKTLSITSGRRFIFGSLGGKKSSLINFQIESPFANKVKTLNLVTNVLMQNTITVAIKNPV